MITIFFSLQTGDTAEKQSILSTSSSGGIHGYLGDGESYTSHSILSLATLDDEVVVESTFEEQLSTPESMCGEEPDTCQTTGKTE